MFKDLLALVLSSLMIVSMTGCGSDDDSTPDTKKVGISILHASPDAPKVNVIIDGAAALSEVDFAQGAGLSVDSAIYNIAVEGILPGGETAAVIGPLDLMLYDTTRYAIIAANDVAAIEPIIVTAEAKEIASDMVRVQVIHATSSAPTVDVYVTAPDADISDALPIGTLSYKEFLVPVEVPAASYQVRITPQDSKDVLFDSGTITLAGGSDLMVAAIANVGNNGTSPVQLAVLDGETSSIIRDVNTPASIRVVHNSPDAPAVDIVVNDNFTTPLVSSLAYPEFTAYVDVPADTYNIKVAVANTETSVIDENLTLAQASMSSVYAINTVANIEPLVLVDDNRKVATEAKVRIVHGSPSAGNVDIYVTSPDADIAMTTPAFSDVPFKAETGYVALATGDYQVRVTVAGTKTVAIDTGTLSLSAGKIYTAIARDPIPTDHEGSFGLILMDDFNE